MAIDVKNMTRKELEKLQRDIEKALERLRKKDMKAARAAAEKAAATHGFTLSELAEAPTTKKAKTVRNPGKPKYRNPADAKQTWTGKGRQPDWFKAAISAGKKPEDMAI